MDGCNPILEAVQSQLSSSFSIAPSGSGCLIETPFEYPDRRILTIHVSTLPSGELELSDDGYAHSYAYVSGVGDVALSRRIQDVARRYGVEASQGEVVITTTPANVLDSLIALVEASQGIADTVTNKRPRASASRLDRQVERALVMSRRVYIRRGRVPVGSREIDVDYNILPSDEHQQLSLFSMGKSIDPRRAESMAWRIERLLNAPPQPGRSGRVVVIADEAGAFSNAERWRKARDTIKDTGVTIVPLSEQREIERWLTA